jgi:hypothetical protein
MDECIRTGVSSTERTLPGRLNLRRRAPMLYQRLMRGSVTPPTIAFAADPWTGRFYSGLSAGSTLSIGPGPSSSAIGAPAVNVDIQNEKSDALSNGNGNGNGVNGEEGVKRAPKAMRVVGSFDHPLLPMTPVSISMCRRGFDCSRACRNGLCSRLSIS